MPTESTFLFAGLLFLAAALGYVFARFGDLDEEGERESAQANFLKGFRYLLNEEPDRAVEIFTGAGDVSEEGMDTQIALGALFRRRGEVDRAIRLHQNLLERPAITVAQRDRASFALAEDYLSAGLFDRAEELYLRLRESREHRVDALRRLLRVCEVTSEWDRAVDLCAELARIARDAVLPGQLAHYYCELAEQARGKQAWDEARQMLAQAEAIEPGKARTALDRGDLAADLGRFSEASAEYSAIARADPAMLSDVLPRLIRSAQADGQAASLGPLLREVAASGDGLRGLALAVIRNLDITDAAAVDWLGTYIDQHPILCELAGADSFRDGSPALRRQVVERIRKALNQLSPPGSGYQCANCGYVSATLHWQCPGCRSWDTVRASDRLLFKGSPL